MQVEDISIKDIDKSLLNASYVSNNEISTTLYLSFLLGKPILIEGPPGVGKTTFLRELSFLLTSGKNPARTAIVDSRYELSADMCFPLADVLLGYPRSVGMEIAVRTMAPEVVVCDEIAGSEDAKAVSTCYSSGVSVIASAHAGSFEQLAKREGIGPLLRDGVFPTVVELFRSDGQVKKRITDASGRELMVCD